MKNGNVEKNQLSSYQIDAINAIETAIYQKQKHIVVEMLPGFGKKVVLEKTIENISKLNRDRVLIVAGNLTLKRQIDQIISMGLQHIECYDKNDVIVETIQKLARNKNEIISRYQIVIFYDVIISRKVYESLGCQEKIVIFFNTINQEMQNDKKIQIPYSRNDIVFSYGYKQAVNDGYLTPAMDINAFEPAVKSFCKKLLRQFGFNEIESNLDNQDHGWDLIMQKEYQKIWVECKAYKQQAIPPSTANSLLKTAIMQKTTHNLSKEDIALLVVLNQIPSFQKEEIYNRYRIIVLDIENLVYYSKYSPELLKQLSQLTYFPIDSIEGKPYLEGKLFNISNIASERDLVHAAEKEKNETSRLLYRLKQCKEGKTHSAEYEDVCEDILRYLFEAAYFNRLESQHKTKDMHFRMDLIGSLKKSQNNDEHMHPLWQMLVQHYNSHFVVFEFKNYTKKIDQNLIYITEKYLFDTALRNVAFIISRKGFSKAAKFAAEGCLKEHGKLILDITEEDLIKMIGLGSDKAADYILDKLEDFLMGISK